MVILLQKTGNATPSVVATLIERLPDEDDPQRPIEEKVAQNVAAIAYIGLWSCKFYCKSWMNPLTIFMFFFPLAGADTVSERNKNTMNNVINCIILDNVNRAGPIPGHGNLSGSPKKSTSRNRCRGGPTSPPRF